MSSRQEFIAAWDRLKKHHLQALAHIARSPELAAVCGNMSVFLADSLNCEADFRDEWKTKPDQVPYFDGWNDSDLADGYFAGLMMQTAFAPSQTLQEFAELLTRCICCEMTARLRAMHLARELHSRG